MATLTIDDIKATIEVIFKQRVSTLIEVGDKGTVLFCRKNTDVAQLYSHIYDSTTYYSTSVLAVDVVVYTDSDCSEELGTITAIDDNVITIDGTEYEFTSINTIEEHGYKTRTFATAVFDLEDEDTLETQIKQIFNGGASEVIVLEYSKTLSSVVEQIKKLSWNWIFTTDEDEQTTIASYCKENSKFGLVYNLKSDSMYVVSCNNPSAIMSDDDATELNTVELLPILVGVIAGCPYDKTISYKVFDELKSVEEPSEIEYGQCTLYNEEEGVRVASPVNTLLTLGENITEDMKSIAIVEGMQRLKEDIIYAFRTGYKGKYKNKYDNQCLFFSACNYYLSQLEDLGVLDPDYNNYVDVNTAKQRKMWIASGKDEDTINKMTDMEIKKLTYKKMVYPVIYAKFLDGIEGMSLEVEMY
ncbi:MAG: hypothetical protein LUE64_06075 [Candidatus Gastranaerophilales bacterium]|nr:hypothetical protein [Candidatus Gastranaerophilales bacterium]